MANVEVITLVIRFLATLTASFFFGLERQRAHKPVGFGTYIFVSIGSTALAITAINLAPENPLPLLSAIVSGIGFLGAGALIKTSDKIFGFTSAASIWLFAILGLTIGVGEYFVAALIYIAVWIIMFYDRNLEERGIGSYQRRIFITTNKLINEKMIREILYVGTKKHKLISMDANKTTGKITLEYLIEGTKDNINKIPKRLYQEEWFESVKVE